MTRINLISIGPAYPYRGGLASFNERLSRQFLSEGQNIRIITFRLQYPKLLFPGKTQYTDGPPPEGISISRIVNSINPLNWLLTGIKIRNEKPDILLMRYWLPFMAPCLGTIARLVRSNGHTKVICIFDNVVPHEHRPGDKIFTRYFISSISGAIVMSRTVNEELRIFNKSIPVKFSPHPLFDNYGQMVERHVAAAGLNLPEDYSYILFFGFIRAYKGLDLLIKAFSDIRLRSFRLKLIVAGEFYEDDAQYRELIKSNNLQSDVIIFDHFIKDDQVPLFFGLADLVVQPYKSATQSGVTQIAFQYDKPMVVTDVGGLREIVPNGKCGYVVKPDPDSISEAILDYFANNRKDAFTEGVKTEKEKFTWDKMTKAIVEVYSEIRNQRSEIRDER